MTTLRNKKYFIFSLLFHVVVLVVLILGFDFSSPSPVLQNTNANNVISAVVLGDTPQSKILPQKLPQVEPIKPLEKQEEKPALTAKKQQSQQQATKKDVIALKEKNEKELAKQKLLAEKKQREKLAKALMTDIKKITEKKKNLSQKKLKQKFENTLREQAEKSLRQQLLNEEIRLQGAKTRQARGEVNKYKALILQAISQHWIIPIGADKSLYCELIIRVAPGGMVLDVQVAKASGDPALDSSARAAVLQASPLPVPNDPNAFEPFRQFVLKVKPENIVESG